MRFIEFVFIHTINDIVILDFKHVKKRMKGSFVNQLF